MRAMSLIACRAASAPRSVALLVAAAAVACAIIPSPAVAQSAPSPRPPNIVIILADDLGYGDVGAFNPDGRVPTPNLDRLARAGVRFVDAHTNSAVCSPTRYGLLTGRYAWRTRLASGVLWGESAPLIEPGRMTIASMLRSRGYETAAIGKWHLGLEWAARAGVAPSTSTENQVEWIDYARPVTRGPLSAGFDRFFGIPASLDMPPYVYLVDDRVEGPPTSRLPGVPSGDPGFYRPGIAAPGFRVESVLRDLTTKAVSYVRGRAKDGNRPFFLYFALTAPHTPVVPGPAFAGLTGVGRYGDFVAETDAAIGEVLRALEEAGVARETLVLVLSDNGPAPAGGIAEALKHGHDASGGFRGAKADLYEGGHRVPFVARWPGVAPAGQTSRRLIGTTDILATLAEIVGVPLPAGAGEDSLSFAAALRDPEHAPARDAGFVMHSIQGAFAIRQGRHKLLLTPGSGGWSDPKPGSPEEQGLPPTQLYDLEADPKETTNLAAAHPETARRLQALLETYRAAGRSAPAPPHAPPAPAARVARPNVLVILGDDYRADAIGASGNPYVQTPTLDRLAAAGALLTGAYNMGGFQGAICTPSRAMLMTSLALTRVREDLEGQATWPEQFARSGYRTFITGKWHNGAESLPRVFQQGRAVFVGGMADPYNLPVRDFSRADAAPVARTAASHDSETFADEAIAFLGAQVPGRPFLCYVAFKAPHDPRVAPAAWHDRFRASPPPAPANFLPEHPFDNGELQIRDELLLPRPRTEAAVRKELADYYASIGHLDEQIGRILAALNGSGLAKDTLVVFSGDNGLAIGSHGLLGKQNLYEHSVRVPLILAGPGVPAGLRSEGLCYLQDVFPTLADLAGVVPIANVFGRSLRPLLDDQAAAVRSTVFTAYRDVQRAIRDERFKLIRYPRIDRTQLFDLRADPLEREDLAGRPEQAATVARMLARLKEAQAELGDEQR